MTHLSTSEQSLRSWAIKGALALIILCSSAMGASLFALKEDLPGVTSRFGTYLAGRQASKNRDVDAAAFYYSKALKLAPKNDKILERAFIQQLVVADWGTARAYANQLLKIKPDYPFGRLYLGVEAFREKQYETAHTQFKRGKSGAVSALVKEVGTAWVLAEKGQGAKAINLLQKKSSSEWVRYFRMYHTALIADKAGLTKIAQSHFARLFKKYRRMPRLAGHYASFLARNGKRLQAVKILDDHFKNNYQAPDLVEMRNRLLNNEPIAPIVQTPAEGLSEIFFSLGEKQGNLKDVDDAIIFLQMTYYLNPKFDAASLNLGEILVQLERYDFAETALARIHSDSPYWPDAMVLRAQSLRVQKKTSDAIAILEEVTKKRPDYLNGLSTIGKLYMDDDKFDKCAQYYSKVLKLIGQVKEEHWHYFYGRGICYERLKQWSSAEADFKQALKLRPNEADVLNYLGYSWVDQNIHLKDAFEMIRKAVKLKPDNGYFVDSLGWAYYRMGDLEKAGRYLEKAVELKPDDPVINDHLGDIYWHLGRRSEAQFQWRQVLTLEPEDELKAKIKIKLEQGIAPLQNGKPLKKASK